MQMHTHCTRNSNKLYILNIQIFVSSWMFHPCPHHGIFQNETSLQCHETLAASVAGKAMDAMRNFYDEMRLQVVANMICHAIMSAQASTVCKHVAQDFRFGVFLLLVTQENTRVLGALKLFWCSVRIISPAKTAAYSSVACPPKNISKLHCILQHASSFPFLQFIGMFMSQYPAWKAERSKNPGGITFFCA